MPHLFPTNPPSKPTASTPTGVRQTATKGGPQQTHGCAFTHLGWPPDDLLSSVDMVDLLFGIGLDADRKPCARNNVASGNCWDARTLRRQASILTTILLMLHTGHEFG